MWSSQAKRDVRRNVDPAGTNVWWHKMNEHENQNLGGTSPKILKRPDTTSKNKQKKEPLRTHVGCWWAQKKNNKYYY